MAEGAGEGAEAGTQTKMGEGAGAMEEADLTVGAGPGAESQLRAAGPSKAVLRPKLRPKERRLRQVSRLPRSARRRAAPRALCCRGW